MRKHWIVLGLAGLLAGYYAVRHALWLRTETNDGTFIFRNDAELKYVFYKYGKRVAVCRDSFCRIGTTRSDDDAIYEPRWLMSDTYLYDIDYTTPTTDVPAALRKKLIERTLAMYKQYYDNPGMEGGLSPAIDIEKSIDEDFGRHFYIEAGPFTTCSWNSPVSGCVRRVSGSDKAPPKGIFPP
jgi:hypothetical protein